MKPTAVSVKASITLIKKKSSQIEQEIRQQMQLLSIRNKRGKTTREIL